MRYILLGLILFSFNLSASGTNPFEEADEKRYSSMRSSSKAKPRERHTSRTRKSTSHRVRRSPHPEPSISGSPKHKATSFPGPTSQGIITLGPDDNPFASSSSGSYKSKKKKKIRKGRSDKNSTTRKGRSASIVGIGLTRSTPDLLHLESHANKGSRRGKKGSRIKQLREEGAHSPQSKPHKSKRRGGSHIVPKMANKPVLSRQRSHSFSGILLRLPPQEERELSRSGHHIPEKIQRQHFDQAQLDKALKEGLRQKHKAQISILEAAHRKAMEALIAQQLEEMAILKKAHKAERKVLREKQRQRRKEGQSSPQAAASPRPKDIPKQAPSSSSSWSSSPFSGGEEEDQDSSSGWSSDDSTGRAKTIMLSCGDIDQVPNPSQDDDESWSD